MTLSSVNKYGTPLESAKLKWQFTTTNAPLLDVLELLLKWQ
jgi:hypothetical protein